MKENLGSYPTCNLAGSEGREGAVHGEDSRAL